MVVCVEKSNEFTKMLLEPSLKRYKINKQNSIVFIYTSKLLEVEIKKQYHLKYYKRCANFTH